MSERPQAGVKSGGSDPLIGRTINDRFRLTGLIARGGMGKVYRAEQAPLGRMCAVKVLHPNYTGDHDPEFHKRFFLEASIASKLTHPNTVTIFDYGKTEDDIYYMAMELLEGATIHGEIRQIGTFTEDRTAHIGRQICRALREAHAHGVIHRDLKPANIFLVTHGDESDVVKVLDFGLVKNVSESRGEDITQTGLFMGSPKYMAPEQIQGDRVDARTDVYSLGIILYEMMTGRVPFDRANSVNILMAQVNEPVPPLRETNPHIEISAGLEEAILRCLEKDMNRRFASMDELLQSLKLLSPGVTGTLETRSADASASIPPVSAAMRIAPPIERFPPPPPLMNVHLSTSPSQTPPAVPDISISRPPPPANSWPMMAAIVVGVGLAAVIGVLGVMRIRVNQADPRALGTPSSPGMNSAPVTPIPIAVLPPASPPTEALVKVRINTEPDGASVKEDGVEVCSSTPCDILYKGPDADAEHAHSLSITHPGFKPEVRAIKVGDSPVSVKLARAPEKPVRGTGNAPGSSTNDNAPKGFKDIPY